MKIDWGKVITSKTLWANVIILALAVLDVIQTQPWVSPAAIVVLLGTVVPCLNIVLRFLTNDALITKPPVP